MTATVDLDASLALLDARLRGLGSVLVCFSGGVDSAFVLAMAHRALGDRAVGLMAASPSVPEEELVAGRGLAARLGVRLEVRPSGELQDPRYAENASNRCYFCKSELYAIARSEAGRLGLEAIANGTNCDDLGDHRPGLDAAREAGVVSPLVECGFTKDRVRAGARAVGLEVWDKPAAACLSSRIPYGTSVTEARLRQIGAAERAIRALGLRQVRVRYHDVLARVEIGESELPRAFALREGIVAACRAEGFTYVTLDLEGYQQGSHNRVLHLPVAS